MDHFPKKIKTFLWEHNLGAINTANHLQRHMPSVYTSPSWCHMCHKYTESAAHLLSIVLLTCSFGIPHCKPSVGRLSFHIKCSTNSLPCWLVILFLDLFLDYYTLSTALYWCKTQPPFNHLSLSYLVSNWKLQL